MSSAKASQRRSVLITGAAGGLAAAVAELLLPDCDVVGADPRPLSKGRVFPGEFIRQDYAHRKMAELFRARRFEALVHLGRVPVTAFEQSASRYNTNVLGTRHLLGLAEKFGVRKVIVLSTHHVYGAHEHNPLQMTEDDPLRASQTFAELADAVEIDHFAVRFQLKHPKIRTVVLRPANVVGPTIRNHISRLLRRALCPTLMGYDPLMQFVHEADLARALVLCLRGDGAGAYNVAGEGVVPYSRAIRLAGATPLPAPWPLAVPVFAALSAPEFRFPWHLVDYFRYPVIMSDDAIQRDFGYRPSVTTVETLRSVRPAPPAVAASPKAAAMDPHVPEPELAKD